MTSIHFPMMLDKRGSIRMDETQEAKDQSQVVLLLGTSVGERVMRPQYGSSIVNAIAMTSAEIFDDSDNKRNGKAIIREAISEAFSNRLPQLELSLVEFVPDFDDGTYIVEVFWFRRGDGPANIQSGRVDVSGFVDKIGQ